MGYLYAAGGETIGPDPIEEKGWIYPTESTKPIVSAPDEFRLTPYHTVQISTIKRDSWSRIYMSAYGYLNCWNSREQTESEKEDKVVTGKEPEQQIEDEQWEFIRDEVEKMKEARELAQKKQQ